MGEFLLGVVVGFLLGVAVILGRVSKVFFGTYNFFASIWGDDED
jgi:hypothetical protein